MFGFRVTGLIRPVVVCVYTDVHCPLTDASKKHVWEVCVRVEIVNVKRRNSKRSILQVLYVYVLLQKYTEGYGKITCYVIARKMWILTRISRLLIVLYDAYSLLCLLFFKNLIVFFFNLRTYEIKQMLQKRNIYFYGRFVSCNEHLKLVNY